MENSRFEVICKTDLYHASREYGFDKFTGVKVLGTFDTLRAANEAIFNYFKEDAQQWFANWGLACIYAGRPNDESFSVAGTDAKGYRYYSRDIYDYNIRKI